jgi:hypothetical protein
MTQFDGESYGGDGVFVGGHVGFLFGRDRRSRLAFEVQFSQPLFGERPNKPGDYVYSFVSVGIRLFI